MQKKKIYFSFLFMKINFIQIFCFCNTYNYLELQLLILGMKLLKEKILQLINKYKAE
jgi:hypothetical protein